MNTVRIDSRGAGMVAHRGVSGLEKENTLCAFVVAENRSYYPAEGERLAAWGVDYITTNILE